jgi:molybdopterin-guanine dinucleotide biosynthesis protein MobB
MHVYGIAGFKNSGKTTLVVELVQELTARGLRVATVKHAHHEFDIDQPGKDSYKHRAAGAAEVIVASRRRWAHIRELGDADEPRLDDLLPHLDNIDLVVVEGYKHGEHRKLEVRRAGLDHPALAEESDTIRAVVADERPANLGIPFLPRDDVAAIADFILADLGPDVVSD